jgi:hypothetical protein
MCGWLPALSAAQSDQSLIGSGVVRRKLEPHRIGGVRHDSRVHLIAPLPSLIPAVRVADVTASTTRLSRGRPETRESSRKFGVHPANPG